MGEFCWFSVKSDDPTLVIENRGLYFGEPESVEIDGEIEDVEGARIACEGDDITLVTWGAMLGQAVSAAQELKEKHGVSAEVINARWVAPFDWETLNKSVAKTKRLLIVHEANVTGGFGAEIAARAQEQNFNQLEAPIKRLGVPDVRMPAAPHLQSALIPDSQKIQDTVLGMINAD